MCTVAFELWKKSTTMRTFIHPCSIFLVLGFCFHSKAFLYAADPIKAVIYISIICQGCFYFPGQERWKWLFFPQERRSHSNGVLMVFVTDCIMFHCLFSLCNGNWNVATETYTTECSPFIQFQGLGNLVPIQTCTLLPFIVGNKWIVRSKALELTLALYNIT